MMTLGKNLLALTVLLMCSAPVLANNKTLFVNGVNAAVHGDLMVDKGEWRNKESYSALRIKAGFQLVRIGFVGLTVGYQKVGFYTAEKNWTKAGASKTNFDYRGPVAELHLFPDAMFGFSVAGFQGEGFSFTKGDNSTAFPVACAGEQKCLDTKMERSRLSVKELTAQVNYTFRPGLQLFVGAGSRQVTGTPSYQVFTTDKFGTSDTWETYNTPKWKIDTQFYLFGLRGTTL
ncbi:MAG TPA: hypothetical protein VE954_09980 [Oligoflexus sp.]|uniref:hypothetical protein n=1 Tax=Oligoflexus sp. TaxID=1971216 RepID=UPI002D5F44D2|nr:hypothetical protein [Oligoflexus sp.]HYX33431.1 hypothetical protein [Oligoflexus sp.]